MRKLEQPKPLPSLDTVCIMHRGRIIGKHPVKITVDMARKNFQVRVPGMQAELNFKIEDVAGVLNRAIKEAMESGVKPDECDSSASHVPCGH